MTGAPVFSADPARIDRARVHRWLSEESYWARGRGVGKLLVAGVVADLEPLGMRRIALATADAHGLYAQFGFAPLPTPERWMTRGT